MSRRTLFIPDLDSLVPCMTDEEQAAVADAVEVGQWTLEMDESRYRDLWVQSQLGNIAVLALTDDAMRRGVKRPKTRQ